jgi:hypothetical protein
MDALVFANGVWKALDQIRNLVYESRGGKATSGGSAAPCPFGELIAINDESEFTQGIRGGIVYCGDKNFNVPYQGINLAASGVWLVFLEIGCESNRDDDNEIILPGIKTSAETARLAFGTKRRSRLAPVTMTTRIQQ